MSGRRKLECVPKTLMTSVFVDRQGGKSKLLGAGGLLGRKRSVGGGKQGVLKVSAEKGFGRDREKSDEEAVSAFEKQVKSGAFKVCLSISRSTPQPTQLEMVGVGDAWEPPPKEKGQAGRLPHLHPQTRQGVDNLLGQSAENPAVFEQRVSELLHIPTIPS